MTNGGLSAPTPISADHDLAGFDCGIVALDGWLKRQALRNESSGASRTYVVRRGQTVVGHYCLVAGGVVRPTAPKPLQGNIPDPIPVMVLGRLATDRTWPGCRIGTALLRDAVLRVLGDAEVVGGPGDAGVRDLGGREAVLSPSRIRHRADDVVLALGDGETGVRAIVMVSMVRLRGRRRGRTMRRRTT